MNKEIKSLELQLVLLKLISTREVFSYLPSIRKFIIFHIDLEKILDYYNKYFQTFKKHDVIKFNELKELIKNYHEEDQSLLEVVNKIQSIDLENYNLKEVLNILISKSLVNELSASKSSDIEKLKKIFNKYENFESIFNKNEEKDLYLPEKLLNYLEHRKEIDKHNYKIMPDKVPHFPVMKDGVYMLVTAYTNIGKTALATTFLDNFLTLNQNRKGPVLLFTTEASYSNSLARLIACHYKRVVPDVDTLIKAGKKFLQEVGPDSFRIINAYGLGIENMKAMIKKENAALVMIDLIDSCIKSDNDDSGFNFHKECRNIAINQCPVIGFTQAGARAINIADTGVQNRRWLDISCVYGSLSSVQGSAETIITIGSDGDESTNRYMQTVKTKTGENSRWIFILHKHISFYQFDKTV